MSINTVVATEEYELMRPPERPAPDRCDEAIFAATSNAARLAVFMVYRDLSRWNFPERFCARAARAADQLANHAIDTIGDQVKVFAVRLSEYDGSVMIEVWDHGMLPPPSTLARSLSQAYVEDWDYAFHDSNLRAVWCTLSPRRRDDVPTQSNFDTKFLYRVLNGLKQLPG
jgi:hypothetical protein